jgi:cytochrome oxidase assembly protein ShyY1
VAQQELRAAAPQEVAGAPEELAAAGELPGAPQEVAAPEELAAAPVAQVEYPDLTDGSHLGYAAQWFTFAGLLLVGYPFFVKKQLTGPRKAGGGRQAGPKQPGSGGTV